MEVASKGSLEAPWGLKILGVVKRGRPPQAPEEVEARVQHYCARYGVAAGPDGLPPFPSGRRETEQHREWLTLYKALQRLRRRAAQEGAARSADEAGPDPQRNGSSTRTPR